MQFCIQPALQPRRFKYNKRIQTISINATLIITRILIKNNNFHMKSVLGSLQVKTTEATQRRAIQLI